MSTEVDLAYYSKPVDVAVEKDGSYSEYWIYTEQLDEQIKWLNNLVRKSPRIGILTRAFLTYWHLSKRVVLGQMA